MASQLVSGQFCSVMVGASEVIGAYNWKFSKKAAIHKRAHGDSAGYKIATSGTKEGSGSFSFDHDPSDPIEDHFTEGDSVTLLLYLTETAYYTVPAIIGEISYEGDIDNGGPVGGQVTFEANGAWTEPT